MNERIKELMVEAGYAAPELAQRAHTLVELVIRDCLSMARSYPELNWDYAAGIDSVRESIESQFGIK